MDNPRAGRHSDRRDQKDGIVRVVFTDFDGVLHAASSATELKRSTIKASTVAQLRSAGLFIHTPVLAEALSKAWDSNEIKVMAHSSWRAHFRDDEIRGFIPELAPWFLGTVGFPTLSRDAAILKWLEMAETKITDYLVLDDSPALFKGGTAEWPNLVLCNPEQGLGDPAVREELNKFALNKRAKADDLGAIEFEPVKLDDLIAELKAANGR
jgi:hypothetical protein